MDGPDRAIDLAALSLGKVAGACRPTLRLHSRCSLFRTLSSSLRQFSQRHSHARVGGSISCLFPCRSLPCLRSGSLAFRFSQQTPEHPSFFFFEGASTCASQIRTSSEDDVYTRAGIRRTTLRRGAEDQTPRMVFFELRFSSAAKYFKLNDGKFLGLARVKLRRGNSKKQDLRWPFLIQTIQSVYGDCAGALVDEDFPISATSERTKARLAAEKAWMDLGRELGAQTNVFRLGGIYGPGRSAVDTIVKQESLSKYQKMRESRLYTARIHVADICQALMACIDIPSSGGIYNIVDDDPAPRAEVFAFARALIEERWPGKIKQSLTTDTEDSVRWKENMRCEKQVSNARLKKELGVMLHYPTYHSGLQSIIESMK